MHCVTSAENLHTFVNKYSQHLILESTQQSHQKLYTRVSENVQVLQLSTNSTLSIPVSGRHAFYQCEHSIWFGIISHAI